MSCFRLAIVVDLIEKRNNMRQGQYLYQIQEKGQNSKTDFNS